MPLKLVEQCDGVRLSVKVVPGASRDRIMGAYGEALKVVVSKAPEGGAANRAVVALVADALGVAAGTIAILRGHTSARKELVVSGLRPEDVRTRLSAVRS